MNNKIKPTKKESTTKPVPTVPKGQGRPGRPKGSLTKNRNPLKKIGRPKGSFRPVKTPPKVKKKTCFTGMIAPGEVRNPFGGNGKIGKRATQEMIKLARARTTEAIGVLVEIMNNKSAFGSDRITAANSILNRAFGKVKDVVELTGADGGPLNFSQYEKKSELLLKKLFGETYAMVNQEEGSLEGDKPVDE